MDKFRVRHAYGYFDASHVHEMVMQKALNNYGHVNNYTLRITAKRMIDSMITARMSNAEGED